MSIMCNILMKLLFIAFISCFLAACQEVEVSQLTGSGTEGDAISASAEIDEAFLRAYARRMFAAKKHAGRVTPEYVLEHVQNMEALIAEGRAREMDRLPEFRQAVHQFQAELLLRALQPDLVPEISRDSVTDEDAKAFFQENIHLYALADLYTVTMFHTREKGEAVILGGAKGREELHAEAALLPGVEAKTLEPMTLERFPEEWKESLQALEPESCGPLLMREDSFVVLCLEELQQGRTQDFETRKEYIRNDVLYSRYREAWRTAYAELRERHGVGIDSGVAERFMVEGLRGDEEAK